MSGGHVSRRRIVFTLAVAVSGSRVAGREPPLGAPPRTGKGRELSHDETLRWVAEHQAWRRVRKTRPIWTRAIDHAEEGRPFSTADHTVEVARKGYVLCVGVAGGPWFQKPENIKAKYELVGQEDRRFAFDRAPRPYGVYRPRASVTNWAARVEGPGIAGFRIRPNDDPEHPLISPSGGYVVRDDTPDPYHAAPDEVWLVQRALFESTYETVP